jgi:hypothetical protein
VDALEQAGTLLLETWKATPPADRAPLTLARSAFENLPYRYPEGKPLALLGDADDDDGDRASGASKNSSAAQQKNSRRITCAFPACDEVFDAGLMRQHVAFHLLHDETATLAAPCGLCGVTQAAQYGSEELGCTSWLEKKSGTLKPKHICKVTGSVSYSHACAKKCSKGAPSTNHLILCPECPTKPMPQFFWKYRCMAAHWKRAHPSITMPESLVADLEIKEEEQTELKKFKSASAKSKAKKRRAAKTKAAPAVVAAEARLQEAAGAWGASQMPPAATPAATTD